MFQLALNPLKNKKKEKSISDFRVVAGLSTSSLSSMKARMTSLESSSITRVNAESFFCKVKGENEKKDSKIQQEMKIKYI